MNEFRPPRMRWHCLLDRGFDIRTLSTVGLGSSTPTESPHNTESARLCREETFAFCFETWMAERGTNSWFPTLHYIKLHLYIAHALRDYQALVHRYTQSYINVAKTCKYQCVFKSFLNCAKSVITRSDPCSLFQSRGAVFSKQTALTTAPGPLPRIKSSIPPPTNWRVVQSVTWWDRPITAVIQLLFKKGV